MVTTDKLEWYRGLMCDGYDSTGTHDKAWDVEARTALKHFSRLWAERAVGDEFEDGVAVLRRVNAAGCRDPLLKYIGARVFHGASADATRSDLATHVAAHAEADRALAESGYSPYLKALGTLRHAQARIANAAATPIRSLADGDEVVKAERLLDTVVSALPSVAADKNVPYSSWRLLTTETAAAYRDLPAPGAFTHEDSFLKVYAGLGAAVIPASVRPMFVGEFFLNYTWEARGTGFAYTISEAAKHLMAERLQKADDALNEAWNLDPQNTVAAEDMIVVNLTWGGRDREMDQWFGRAMSADPGNLTACLKKLNWLEPKWMGSAEEMIEFGHECFRGGNWDARLPFILVWAHDAVAHYGPEGWTPRLRPEYFRDLQVQADLGAVYKAHLQRYPSRRLRNEFQRRLDLFHLAAA